MARAPERRRSGIAAAVLTVLVAVAGCGGPNLESTPPSDDLVTPSPVVTPPPEGAADLLLRYECTIGPIQEADDRICFGPAMSLYADGTLVFRDATAPVSIVDGERRYPPYRQARLTPAATKAWVDEARALIERAAAAPGDPDAPFGDPSWWDVFTVATDGGPLVVSPGQGPMPPHGADTAFLGPLADRLADVRPLDDELAEAVVPFVPERACVDVYLVELLATKAWPWPELLLEDVGLGHPASSAGRVVLPAADVAAIAGDVGGARNVLVTGPAAEGAYSVNFRVLMPDEACAPV
ncbi:MAG TPA: hypothetical protein VK871_12120 [Candidatus Limnocylindrales bacterium]|nr:hypothetical protein [Candidatus Limnocylindrales bacterium]